MQSFKALANASVNHPVPEVRINAGSLLLYITKVSDDPLVWKFRPLYLLLGEEDEKERKAHGTEKSHGHEWSPSQMAGIREPFHTG